MKKRASLLCLLLVILGVAIAGCGSGGGGSSSSGAVEPTESKPSEIKVRVWADPFKTAIADTAGKAFEEETGIKVVFDTTDEAVSQTKVVQAIRAGQRPPVDMSMQLQTRGYLNGVQGLNIPLDPKIVTNLASLPTEFAAPPGLSRDEGWQYANMYLFTVPIIYNKEKVKASELTSWRSLLSPKFRNRIEIDDQYGGAAFSYAKELGIDPGDNPPGSMDPVWTVYEEMRPNISSSGNDEDAVKALTSGQAWISIHATVDGIAAAEEGVPIAYATPKDGITAIGDSVYIHQNIPDNVAYWAEKFVNTILSPEVQTELANELGGVPINPEATLPAYMKENPKLFPATAEELEKYAIPAPWNLMARHQEEWQSSYEEAIK